MIFPPTQTHATLTGHLVATTGSRVLLCSVHVSAKLPKIVDKVPPVLASFVASEILDLEPRVGGQQAAPN